MKIGIIGLGYVGYSLCLLYSSRHSVFAVDVDESKVKNLNKRLPILKDKDADHILDKQDLNLSCSTKINHLSKCEVIFLCLPTNFISKNNAFDTDLIKKTLQKLIDISDKETFYIIKSTVPIGFTKKMNEFFETDRIVFSPEFLREGSAIRDNLYPDRIILGGSFQYHDQLLGLLKSITKTNEVKLFGMSSCEAESVKLMSNSYLAMRVAFFNELDSMSMELGLNAKNIIDGVSADNRVGNYYNNPSFGYGGYCLPKDTKQLRSQTKKISHNAIFSSIIISNSDRINFLAKKILKLGVNFIGIYGLAMKKDSDNFRESAMLKLIEAIKIKDSIDIVIYDPDNFGLQIEGISLEKNFQKFVESSEIIVANRMDRKISPYINKIFTRDVYDRD
jgi:UDPglucose 6-dehydrogenase